MSVSGSWLCDSSLAMSRLTSKEQGERVIVQLQQLMIIFVLKKKNISSNSEDSSILVTDALNIENRGKSSFERMH